MAARTTQPPFQLREVPYRFGVVRESGGYGPRDDWPDLWHTTLAVDSMLYHSTVVL